MKITNLRTLIPVVFAFSTACAHYSERLKTDLDPWLGKHPDQLVERWGAPDSTYPMSSGVKVLTYTSDRTVSRYSGMSYTAWRFGNYSYTDSCKISFFTDVAQKIIERYATTGEAGSCVEVLRDYPKAN
ncbi:MAG: hypothetical protein EOP10_03510 [Proteobacteria bacterium]|nr:MAG: hypothetical protein EOP10_03510 [Pseudomonadota bacterium]